jgi:LuxR family transcriptional regulator, maltose regulon positive regulatory protein
MTDVKVCPPPRHPGTGPPVPLKEGRVLRPGGGMEPARSSLPLGALVLASKLAPDGRRGVVVRQALLDRLGDDQLTRLSVVVAPAGWGKTSLLRDWRAAGRASRTGWLSLDRGDNDPVRFWAHVMAAVASVVPDFGAKVMPVLAAPGASITDSVLPLLVNELAALDSRLTLVVDDYDLIGNQDVLAGMAFLVEHLPPTLRLVLGARSDPQLPLARLRAHGEMTEIRVGDLRFTEAEAAALLNDGLGLGLAHSDILALQQRTEGWAAGLYLAGLSLRGRAEPSRYIAAFAGDDSQVADYLAAEVLAGLPPEVRIFLLRTSILDRLCGPLCDAVTGADDSQHILEQVERSSLFLIPLDSRRRWYRYHHLFAGMLQRELERAEPGLAAELHRRAAAWHQGHGSAADAISHAMSAGDLTDAGELIVSHWNAYFNEGLTETVESWLDQLPREMVIQDPRLCLIRGWLARHLGRLDEVEPWIEAAQAAQAGMPESLLPEEASSVESSAIMLRAGHRYMTGDLAGAEPPSRRAVELQDSGVPDWRAGSLATLGANLCWQGRDSESIAVLTRVAGPAHRSTNPLARLWAMGCLAAICARAGDLETAIRYIQGSERLAAEHALGEYWVTATALVTSAEIPERQGDLPEAEAAARRALELARRGWARLETSSALLCLARIRFRTGDIRHARSLLGEAREIIAGCADPGILTGHLADAERLISLQGPSSAARQPGLPEPLSPREQEVLRWLSSQLTLRQIAGNLFVSYYTMKTHTRHIYRKLGVATREQAVARIKEGSTG